MSDDESLTPAQTQRCMELADEIVALSDKSDECVNSIVALTLVVANVLFQLVKTEYYPDVMDDLREFSLDALDEAEARYEAEGNLQ